MTIRGNLPLPSPAILRKKQAATYLGMSIDMFERNIKAGIIENGAKLLPSSKDSTILGWSIKKLEKARSIIDGEPGLEDDFEKALENYHG